MHVDNFLLSVEHFSYENGMTKPKYNILKQIKNRNQPQTFDTHRSSPPSTPLTHIRAQSNARNCRVTPATHTPMPKRVAWVKREAHIKRHASNGGGAANVVERLLFDANAKKCHDKHSNSKIHTQTHARAHSCT